MSVAAAPAPATSAGTRFPRVDGLRALAALGVLAYHGLFQVGAALGERSVVHPVRELVAHLDAGVSVFFVLSGFLLYRPFVVARLSGAPAPRTGAYAWRRALRIVPAYWVALTVAALALSLHEVGARPLLFYGFAQAYSGTDALGGIGQAWTLGAEVAFYALLPAWAALLRRLGGGVRTEWLGVAALFAGGVAWQAIALAGPAAGAGFAGTDAPWLMTLPGFLDQFALGMALAVASVACAPRLARLSRWGWPAAAAALVVVSYALEDTAAGERMTDLQYLIHHQLYGIIGLGALAPAIAAARGPARAVLGWRPLMAVGTISYGVYLWHVYVMTQLGRWDVVPHSAAGHAAWFLLVLALSLAVAAASWRLVERPALSLKRLAGPELPPGFPASRAGSPKAP